MLVVLVVAVVDVMPVMPVPPVAPVVMVVSVMVGVPVPTVLTTPVVPVVSVADGPVDVIDVSTAAVSVFTFSCFLQETENKTRTAIARRVRTRDFVIRKLLRGFRGNPGDLLQGCERTALTRRYSLRTTFMMSSRVFTLRTAAAAPETRTVQSFDGTTIYYDLYDHTSRGAVLVVPGFWRFRRHPSMRALAAQLNALGYRAAIVDPRGHGDSGGTYGFNLHEHHDVFAVAEELLRRLPIESITLIGLSYGGAVAVSTAARHTLPLASLLLISPVADFQMIVPKINLFTFHRHIAWSQALHKPRFNWRTRRDALRPLDDVGNVHAPLCLIHVKNDWLVSHQHSLAFYEAANEPKELHVIDMEGNYHADRIFSVASAEIDPIVAEFLAKYTPV